MPLQIGRQVREYQDVTIHVAGQNGADKRRARVDFKCSIRALGGVILTERGKAIGRCRALGQAVDGGTRVVRLVVPNPTSGQREGAVPIAAFYAVLRDKALTADQAAVEGQRAGGLQRRGVV